jgi:hypothetical protein
MQIITLNVDIEIDESLFSELVRTSSHCGSRITDLLIWAAGRSVQRNRLSDYGSGWSGGLMTSVTNPEKLTVGSRHIEV